MAKRKESIYYMGKRSKDWVKFKRMADEDFITTGYIQKGKNIHSIILGIKVMGRYNIKDM